MGDQRQDDLFPEETCEKKEKVTSDSVSPFLFGRRVIIALRASALQKQRELLKDMPKPERIKKYSKIIRLQGLNLEMKSENRKKTEATENKKRIVEENRKQ
jgi:hypothetical protein